MELMANETMVWQGRPSWRAMMVFYVTWIVVGLVPLIAAIVIDRVRDTSSLTGLGALASAVIVAWALIVGWVRRISTLYTITDHRIVIRRGILSRKERSAHIDRVQNVNLNQTIMDRIFQVGTLDFDTAGTEDSDFSFAGIADPSELRARIDREYVQRARETGRGQGL